MLCRSLSRLGRPSQQVKCTGPSIRTCAIRLSWPRKSVNTNGLRLSARLKRPITRKWSRARNTWDRRVCSWLSALSLKKLSATCKIWNLKRRRKERKEARRPKKAAREPTALLKCSKICRRLFKRTTSARTIKRIRRLLVSACMLTQPRELAPQRNTCSDRDRLS